MEGERSEQQRESANCKDTEEARIIETSFGKSGLYTEGTHEQHALRSITGAGFFERLDESSWCRA